MAVKTEIELKLRLAGTADVNNICSDPLLAEKTVPGTARCETLESFYYDTPGHALKSAGLAYRIRRERGQWIATVKGDDASAGGLHQRSEWNVAVAAPAPDRDAFRGTPVGSRLEAAIKDEPLTELFRTRFARQSFELALPDGSRVELAADLGEIVAGKRRAPIREIELELKAGDPPALLSLGAALARRYPLLPEPYSKFHRGLMLIGLTPDKQEELSLVLSSTENVRQVLGGILIYSVHLLVLAQEEFLAQPGDPERLHQLGTRFRRLCTLLSFGRPLLIEADFTAHWQALRPLGRRLSSLREFDVLHSVWQEVTDESSRGSDTLSQPEDLVDSERQQAREELVKILASGKLTPILLELWAWLLNGPWREVAEAQLSFRDFIAGRFRAWREEPV